MALQIFKLEFIRAVCLHYLRRCSRISVVNEAAVQKNSQYAPAFCQCNRRPAAESVPGRDVTESQLAGLMIAVFDRWHWLPAARGTGPRSEQFCQEAQAVPHWSWPGHRLAA